MDIIASILAYLVSMTGIVTGLVLSFVVFFSTPGQQGGAASDTVAVAAMPSSSKAAKAFPVKTIATSRRINAHGPSAATADAAPRAAVALDARQKPLLSRNQVRRLAEKERARHLAFRERASFESRFLHYDD